MTPSEPEEEEVMDFQKETCCRHLPLYSATSIPVPGVTPSGLIFRTSDKESAEQAKA